MKLKGIIQITGEHDAGKTLAALGLTHPSKTIFIHDDVKTPPVDKDEFGVWLDIVDECQGMSLLQVKEYVLEFIKQFEPGKYDAIVFDTWSRFGLSLRSYGKLHATEFREKETMAAGQVYKYGQEWGEGHLYEASIIGHLSNIAPLVILTSHLNDFYQGGAKTGKKVPNSGKSLDRVCNLRLWLRHNPDSAVPIALVLKRLSRTDITENGIEVVNILPRKITPLDNENSIWQSVERYWKNPVGNRQPNKDEEPNEYELSILDGILTDDQKQIWKANLMAKELEDNAIVEAQLAEEAEIKQFINSMNGASILELKGTLEEKYQREFGLDEIGRLSE